MELKELITNLPEPTIFTTISIEEIIQENVDLMKSINPEWIPIESDANMMQIEAFSYKEMFLRNMFNQAIKEMLPHYSSKENLDNFVFGFYGGELRLEGAEPKATYKFELESVLSVDIIIPKGLELSDVKNQSSYVDENITILAGELEATGKVQLNLKVKSSSIKTEIVISPFPYILTPKALENFSGGSDVESDEDFFKRAILSLNRYSTAGGKDAYKFFAYSSDERVFDVEVISPEPMKVDVIVLAHKNKSEVVANVNTALTGESKVQAFCDEVTVKAAKSKEVTLSATIDLFDLLKQKEIITLINKNFNNKFKIGESLPYSSIISKMHISGVYKVVLGTNTDISVLADEYIDITAINISVQEANL
ncbi:baseplate J/gp47 family protein [Sulfurimonas sp.]|uniref:baseplate J/gp47 family protein n=1 Tax=Sulfurimonas sp. TaxID=2022749 RepID=UPI0025F21E04|nr:baseplate J/gp47 family protein [Sulfurimonas sp.]